MTDSANPGPADTADTAGKRPAAPGLIWLSTRLETKVFWRTPVSAFFSIFFPLLLFVVFALVFGNEEIEYLGITTAQFYAPSLAVYAAVASSYSTIAIATAYQRDEGILKRVRGTPLPAWIYLSGKITSATINAAIGTVIMLGVGVIFFDLRLYADTILVLVLIFVVGVFCFAALGLLVAAVSPSGQAATAIANATLLPLAFISGVFVVPGENMPEWLEAIANFFPLKHFAEPFVAAFTPEATRADFSWASLAYLALWGIVGLIAAVRLFRWEPRTGSSGRRASRKSEAAA
jgi:ABC-2 type transport system permease protein